MAHAVPSKIVAADFKKWQDGVLATLPASKESGGCGIEGLYPQVMISYATGNREGQDAKGAGPGTKHCYDIVMALEEAGIPTFSGLHVDVGVNWKLYYTKLDGRPAKVKVFIIVLTRDLFTSLNCLQECFRAIRNMNGDAPAKPKVTITKIIPVMFEDGKPSQPWPDVEDDDMTKQEWLSTVMEHIGVNCFPPPTRGLMCPELLPELVSMVQTALGMPATASVKAAPVEAKKKAAWTAKSERGTWVERGDGAIGRLCAAVGVQGPKSPWDGKGGTDPGTTSCVEVRWGSDGSVNVVEAATLTPIAGGTADIEGFEALTTVQQNSCRWYFEGSGGRSRLEA